MNMLLGQIRPLALPKKQTQSNPIAAGVLSGAQHSRMDLARVLSAVERVYPPHRLIYPSVQNKPNFHRFWPEHADRAKKQTQSNPIAAGVL
ncbi:MAG: hypothetical protein ACYTAS_24500, partial [Planctomycetota bacterium]